MVVAKLELLKKVEEAKNKWNHISRRSIKGISLTIKYHKAFTQTLPMKTFVNQEISDNVN